MQQLQQSQTSQRQGPGSNNHFVSKSMCFPRFASHFGATTLLRDRSGWDFALRFSSTLHCVCICRQFHCFCQRLHPLAVVVCVCGGGGWVSATWNMRHFRNPGQRRRHHYHRQLEPSDHTGNASFSCALRLAAGRGLHSGCTRAALLRCTHIRTLAQTKLCAAQHPRSLMPCATWACLPGAALQPGLASPVHQRTAPRCPSTRSLAVLTDGPGRYIGSSERRCGGAGAEPGWDPGTPPAH